MPQTHNRLYVQATMLRKLSRQKYFALQSSALSVPLRPICIYHLWAAPQVHQVSIAFHMSIAGV